MFVEQQLPEPRDRNAIIRDHVLRAYKHYGLSPELLQVQEGHLIKRTTDFLRDYGMDDIFYVNPENTLYALALVQERDIALEKHDYKKADRSVRAFELLTSSDKTASFSYSAHVRDEYAADFTPKNEPPLRRSTPTQIKASLSPLSECLSLDIGGTRMGEIVEGVEEALQHRARYNRNNIQVAMIERQKFRKHAISAFTHEQKIYLPHGCDPHTAMHELFHAYVGIDLLRGYKGFFLRGVMEAFTESLTQNPFYYRGQRDVLEAASSHIGKGAAFMEQLRTAYIDGQLDGMWKMLISTYGLRSVIFWGLMDTGTSTFMQGMMGEKSASVYIPIQEALDFFSRPHI